MNIEVVEKLCGVIGDVCKPADKAECDGSGFMRVCVLVDVNQPFYRGRVVTREDGNQFLGCIQIREVTKLCY